MKTEQSEIRSDKENVREIAIAYRCPSCGASVLSPAGIFTLTGDMLKLKCECGDSELTAAYTPARKLRVSAPCIVCGKAHSYMLDPTALMRADKEALKIPCGYTGIDLCFIGTVDKIGKAIEEANGELVKIMQDAGLQDIADLHREDDEKREIDPEVDDIVRFMVADLREEGKIHCRCKSQNRASYKYTILDKFVRIYCEGCGAIADFPLTGAGSAAEFLSTDEINLE